MKRWLQKNKTNIILVCLMLLGVCLIAYPSVADWVNSFSQSRVIMSYVETVANMDEKEYQRILDEAAAYNEKRAETGNLWHLTKEEEAEYNRMLSFDSYGVMGYITIPKINVNLPIHHGTDERVLQTSIGHLSGTSLPIGGYTAHTVLTGHRGLPSAKLFTNLDKLVIGDIFTINVLNETYTYQVDAIHIVEPEDVTYLQMESGKDLCTLVTCTPYGINTHRLLVRGHRIPNLSGDGRVVSEAVVIEPQYVVPFVGIPVVTVFLIITLIHTKNKKKEMS